MANSASTSSSRDFFFLSPFVFVALLSLLFNKGGGGGREFPGCLFLFLCSCEADLLGPCVDLS